MGCLKPEHYAFLEFIFPIVSGIMFIVAFATDQWIDTDTVRWGLWLECTKSNETVNGHCRYMEPGETDGAYEAARLVSCLALICYLFVGLSVLRVEGRPNKLCYLYNPSIVAAVSVVLSMILLALVGGTYNKGSSSPWSGMSVSLEWSYWLVIGTVGVQIFVALLLFRRGFVEHKSKKFAKQKKPWINPEHLDLLQLAIPVATAIVYVVGFAIPDIVETQSGNYSRFGLWQQCDTNGTVTMKDTDESCGTISPGASDAYFEVARVLSCFALVGYLFGVFLFFLQPKIPKKDHHVVHFYHQFILEIIAVVLTVISVISLRGGFKDDSRWKHKDPILSFAYYLLVGAAWGGLLSILLLFRWGSQKREATKRAREEQKKKKIANEKKAKPTKIQVSPVPSDANGDETEGVKEFKPWWSKGSWGKI